MIQGQHTRINCISIHKQYTNGNQNLEIPFRIAPPCKTEKLNPCVQV